MKIEYEYGELDQNGNLDQTKNNGNVARQKITVPQVGQSQGFTATQSYTYDELNRLKSAVETGNSQTWWQQHFRYDRYGNRTVVTEQNRTGQEAFTTSSIVGLNPDVETSNNRIKPKQNSTEQYLFDASGNMTRDAEGNTFTFDAENHQKTYTPVNPNEPSAAYHYDGDGKRVKKVVGEEVTIFIYNGAGALAAEYTQNAPVNNNPQTVYTTVDSLGTPRINTNQKGETVARHDYLPFGDEIVGLGARLQHSEYVDDDVRQKFTGYEKDKETGLDFAQARYYGNGLGRFTSVDPAVESIKPILPQSWNRYSYVINNPLKFVDPTGMRFDDPDDPPMTDEELIEAGRCDECSDYHQTIWEWFKTTEQYFQEMWRGFTSRLNERYDPTRNKFGTGVSTSQFFQNYNDDLVRRQQFVIDNGAYFDFTGIQQAYVSGYNYSQGKGSDTDLALSGGNLLFSIIPPLKGGSGLKNVVKSGFSASEQSIADVLSALGRKVIHNPKEGVRGAGRQGDAIVDGVKYEFKTLDPGATSNTIRRRVNESISGKGQARNMVIDVRNTGMNKAEAVRGAARSFGLSRGKLDSLTIIGDNFFFVRLR